MDGAGSRKCILKLYGEAYIQQRLLLVADGDDDVLKTNTFLPPSQDVIDHNRVITSNVSTIELR